MVAVRVSKKGVDAKDSAKALDAALDRLAATLAQDMVEQARRNMLTQGGPGGDWPQLSGFRGASKGQKKKRRVDAKAVALREGGDTKKTKVSPHTGYAQRKAEGKTPGAGKFGPDVRLRDTGELFASLAADVKKEPNRLTLSLTARGERDGISNADLLRAHADGEGNLPPRDPSENMQQFEKRADTRVAQHMKNVAKPAR
jgi:hypothetical protein